MSQKPENAGQGDGRETVTIPASMLPSWLIAEAKAYARHMAQREEWEAEEKLRSGRATIPEKIKAAWKQYGPSEWGAGNWQVSIPAHMFTPLSRAYEALDSRAIPYETFLFEREITHNPSYTVTRIHCGGLTVEETVTFHKPEQNP